MCTVVNGDIGGHQEKQSTTARLVEAPAAVFEITLKFLEKDLPKYKMLDGLTYHPGNAVQVLAETRAGIPKYQGGPIGFEEWKFKVFGKVANI